MLPRLLFAVASSGLALACAAHPAPTQPAPPPEPEAAAPAPPPAAPAPSGPRTAATTAQRVVLSFGRPSGTSTITTAADGSITTTLDVLENGRGPHTEATLTMAPDGTIARMTANGHHTFGATYTATFARTGNHASWNSEEESAEHEVHGAAFYVPAAELPEVQGWLVAAALRNGGTIPLLPSGTARVEKTGDVAVTGKNGEARTLTGYAIFGLDLLPTQTWMNPDGSWFGFVSEWYSVIPDGWDAVIPPLVANQLEQTRARDARLAQQLAHKPPAAGLAYTHARVLDVERGRWLADQTVIVVGDTIASVGPSKTAVLPAGAEVVDLAGKALLPGMVDMHSHLGDTDGALDLAAGVTTARDVGNDPDRLDDYKQRFDAGSAIGPHVLRFGFIEGRNPKAASSKITAETPDEARAGVKFFVDRHYDGIKIYNSMRPELVPIITAEAHKAGLPVTGHIPVHMLANEAVRAGYDGIEHINMLFLNFLATHDTDTRDTTRFSLVGDRAVDFDLKGKPMREFIQLLLAHKTIIDPTVDAFEELLVAEQGKIPPGLEGLVARLPVQAQRGYLTGGLPLDAAKHARYTAAFNQLLAMIKTLYDAKVRLVIGTDELAGLSFHHELALFARAGVPNAAILRMATLDPARYLGRDKKTGSIAPGKIADLVVVDGDPLARIDDIGKTVTTMRAGIEFPSAPLYASVGVEPYGAEHP
ncbi:MAG TPA: amidohydrolase family protein [Kofleriaceae bacterium]|jgi:imidazolonepropionase-like amidohydrolase|nr:amidohydrolase family protein [Kofleriaceae bacterium]